MTNILTLILVVMLVIMFFFGTVETVGRALGGAKSIVWSYEQGPDMEEIIDREVDPLEYDTFLID